METPEVTSQLTFTLLLLPLGIVLATSCVFGALVIRHVRRNREPESSGQAPTPAQRSAVHHGPSTLNLEQACRWCAIQDEMMAAGMGVVGDLAHSRRQ